MPRERSIDQLSPEQRQVELVSVLADGLMRYATSGRLGLDQVSQKNSLEAEAASLELGAKSVLSVNRPEAADGGL